MQRVLYSDNMSALLSHKLGPLQHIGAYTPNRDVRLAVLLHKLCW
jgi:hypothetical protein